MGLSGSGKDHYDVLKRTGYIDRKGSTAKTSEDDGAALPFSVIGKKAMRCEAFWGREGTIL